MTYDPEKAKALSQAIVDANDADLYLIAGLCAGAVWHPEVQTTEDAAIKARDTLRDFAKNHLDRVGQDMTT